MSIAPASRIAVVPDPVDAGTTFEVADGEGDRFPAAPFARYTALVWKRNEEVLRGTNAEEITILDREGDLFTCERASAPVEWEQDWSIAVLSAEPVTQLLVPFSLTYDFGAADAPYSVDVRKPDGFTESGSAYVTDGGSGHVSYSVTPSVAGLWHARFIAAGGAVSPEMSFYVLPSGSVDG